MGLPDDADLDGKTALLTLRKKSHMALMCHAARVRSLDRGGLFRVDRADMGLERLTVSHFRGGGTALGAGHDGE